MKEQLGLGRSLSSQIRTNKHQQSHLLHPTMAGHGMLGFPFPFVTINPRVRLCQRAYLR